MPTGEPQSSATIPGVLSTIEQRQFWERVYIEYMSAGYERGDPEPYAAHCGFVADEALKLWRERFDPKAAR